MKKFLLCLLFLFILCTSSEASNVKQQLHEKTISIDHRLMMHYLMIKNDYDIYKEDNDPELSLYASIVDLKKNKGRIYIDNFYLNKIDNLYMDIVNTDFEKLPSNKEFQKKKIIISDEDFDNMDKDIQGLIDTLNIY